MYYGNIYSEIISTYLSLLCLILNILSWAGEQMRLTELWLVILLSILSLVSLPVSFTSACLFIALNSCGKGGSQGLVVLHTATCWLTGTTLCRWFWHCIRYAAGHFSWPTPPTWCRSKAGLILWHNKFQLIWQEAPLSPHWGTYCMLLVHECTA